MIDFSEFRQMTRRNFLLSGGGLGSIALAHLLAADDQAPQDPLAPKRPHFPARAKSVIFLFMEGAPSQLDLFDPKPALRKWAGMPLPASVTKELQLAFIKPTAQVFPSPRTFAAYGQCGTEFSDFIPQVASCADDLCLVRSMHTEAFNHHPGQALLMSGSIQLGRPTAGAWVTYGLGSESQELPGFVVLSSGRGTSAGSNNWSSGFLPSTYQGVVFRSSGDPILYLENPSGISRETQQARIRAINRLNAERYRETGDSAITARIQSYELAFRMQMAAPKLLDFSDEKPATLEMYGVDREPTRPYATNCLLARRMVERGVRFVMLAHGTWDDHQEINKKLKKNCDITDQPVAALIKDLKQRGLLDSTLLVWGGEFGRTPMAEQQHSWEDAGRDHHPNCFSMWLAGGGIKGGQVIGSTDELGIDGVEERVHIHDLHATMLHCLGMDHKKLTYRHMGRDFRLTDVSGRVVEKMIA